MTLSRRKFLKLAGASALATLPALRLFNSADAKEIAESTGSFMYSDELRDELSARLLSEGHEFGNAVAITREMENNLADFKGALRVLIVDAKKTLPPGCKFEIRMKIPTEDYGQSRGIAWYTNKYIARSKERLFLNPPSKAIMNTLGGYCLLGRGRA